MDTLVCFAEYREWVPILCSVSLQSVHCGQLEQGIGLVWLAVRGREGGTEGGREGEERRKGAREGEKERGR